MKKVFLIVLMLLTISLHAQDVVTKFMGIPVDGKKSTMISKLKKKGFKYDRYDDCLTGRFNGRNVKLYIVDNNKKVYRICVIDAYTSNQTDIIIRYNNLIDQFDNNENYRSYIENVKIDYEENLHNEMTYHNKRYEAIYFQKDSVDYYQIGDKVDGLSYYDVCSVDPEYVDNFHNRVDNMARSYGEEYYKMYYLDSIVGKNKEEIFEFDKNTFKVMSIALNIVIEEKRTVWFMISEDDNNYKQYKICMYYDNLFNAPNGEDL